MGEPLSMQRHNQDSTAPRPERLDDRVVPCPYVWRFYLDYMGALDRVNAFRQWTIGLENHWQTRKWYHRFYASYYGTIVVNAWLAAKHFGEGPISEMPLKEFSEKLAMELLGWVDLSKSWEDQPKDDESDEEDAAAAATPTVHVCRAKQFSQLAGCYDEYNEDKEEEDKKVPPGGDDGKVRCKCADCKVGGRARKTTWYCHTCCGGDPARASQYAFCQVQRVQRSTSAGAAEETVVLTDRCWDDHVTQVQQQQQQSTQQPGLMSPPAGGGRGGRGGRGRGRGRGGARAHTF